MILSDLLGLAVHDENGAFVGHVLDARFVVDGEATQSLADARLDGFVISPHSTASYLGYDRNGVDSPVILSNLLRFIHRGTFYVRWPDVAQVGSERMLLRPGYRRFAPGMP